MLTTLRVLLGVLGVSALLICLSIFFMGAASTASGGEHVFDMLTGWRGPDTGPWPPVMDNELRFYAPFWGAYGILLILTVRTIGVHLNRTPWLAGVFFLGGVGRAISYRAVGAPHPFFTLLMAIELLTPPVLILLWLNVRRTKLALQP